MISYKYIILEWEKSTLNILLHQWLCLFMNVITRFRKDIAVITYVWGPNICVTCNFTILEHFCRHLYSFCATTRFNTCLRMHILVNIYFYFLSMVFWAADSLMIFCRSSKTGNCKKKRLFRHKSSAILSSFQTTIKVFSYSTFYIHKTNRLYVWVSNEH